MLYIPDDTALYLKAFIIWFLLSNLNVLLKIDKKKNTLLKKNFKIVFLKRCATLLKALCSAAYYLTVNIGK